LMHKALQNVSDNGATIQLKKGLVLPAQSPGAPSRKDDAQSFRCL